MNSSEKHKIDEYLLGVMEFAERKKFEEQLANNVDLRNAMEEQRALISIVDALGDIQMKERVRRIQHLGKRESGKAKNLSRVWKIALAVAVAVGLGFACWFYLQPSSPMNEKLFAENYEPYAVPFGVRGNTVNQLLMEAGNSYKNGDYEKAVLIFEPLLNEDLENKDAVYLALGISFIELKSTDKALFYFEALAKKINSPYNDQGQWYAALTWLLKNDIEKTKEYMQPLADDNDSFYHEQARKFILSLK